MKKLSNLAFIALAGFGLAVFSPVQAASVVPGIDEKKIEEITKAVSPSVVRVEARNGVFKVATGVVIDKDGSIVTTALISPRDETINVVTSDGKRHKAEFKGFDTQTGIAVVQVKDGGLAPIALGRSSNLRPGAWIGVIGLSPENTTSVTQGIVSSVAEDRIRLNVWVVPGSSGSPVVNDGGQMIGLLRGAYTDDQPLFFQFREQQVVGSGTVFSRAEAGSAGMALAVPVDIVGSVTGDIRKTGKVERGWLGVSVSEEDDKVVITEIQAKSPAEMAKFKEGDVIVKIGEKDIAGGQALSQEIRRRKPGTDVTVKVERDGKPMDIKVKLGEYSEEDARRELEINFPGLFSRFPAPTRPDKPTMTPRLPRTPAPAPRLDEFFSRKFIGVTLQNLTKDLAGFFGVKDGEGLLVAEVAEDSPAQKAGLKAGDVILKADGEILEGPGVLSELIQDKKKGDKIKLDIVRDKKPMTVEVEIGEQKGDESVSWFSFPGDEGRFPWSLTEDMKRALEATAKAYESQGKKLIDSRKAPQDLLRIMKLRGNLFKI